MRAHGALHGCPLALWLIDCRQDPLCIDRCGLGRLHSDDHKASSGGRGFCGRASWAFKPVQAAELGLVFRLEAQAPCGERFGFVISCVGPDHWQTLIAIPPTYSVAAPASPTTSTPERKIKFASVLDQSETSPATNLRKLNRRTTTRKRRGHGIVPGLSGGFAELGVPHREAQSSLSRCLAFGTGRRCRRLGEIRALDN